jgi:hypothetical protein
MKIKRKITKAHLLNFLIWFLLSVRKMNFWTKKKGLSYFKHPMPVYRLIDVLKSRSSEFKEGS